MPTKDFRHVRKAAIVKKPDGGRIKVGSYRPDKKNSHDKIFKSSQFSASNLPPTVDLRPYMTPVENQGESNSCTANAMAGAYEYLAKRLTNQVHNVSRLFIYYNARELDGNTDQDEGTYLRSCIKVLKKYGTCSEQTWPFDLHHVHTSPEETAYTEAANFLVEDAYRVDVDLDMMRSCLAEGYPFTFGLQLFSSFQKAGSSGLVPMPDPDNDRHDGGHAMLCVGYSDSDKVFIVRNSWGEDWGDCGYCYIPYDYMTNPGLNGDLWSIRRVADAGIDLSQGVQGEATSLFSQATAAIASALQVAGSSSTVSGYETEYTVEYEAQCVYVEGQGFLSADAYADLELLYYQDYEDEEDEDDDTEEYEVTEESYEEESEEESEETEDSYEEESEDEEFEEDEDEESEEIEDSYEEESEDEEFEEEEESEENEEESEEIEESYEEESEESEEEEGEEEEESEETEDSYEEESEEEEEPEETEDSYEEEESGDESDEVAAEEDYESEEESDVEDDEE